MTAVLEPAASQGALITENRAPSLWRHGFAVTSIGVFALTFMLAFEALAVSTVMPGVAAALGGTSWYALAFAAPAAVSVVALTLAGPWMDRNGPRGAVYVGAGVFAGGLLIAGLAVSMPMFLLGRGLQGFGGGVIGVGIAVLIARVYPEELRPRMFALLTGAWVLPGLVGPFIAAAVAAAFGWRWVFLGVPALAFVAVGLLTRALCRCVGDPDARVGVLRVVYAALAATGVLLLAVGGQRTWSWWPVLVVAGITLVLSSAPRLLPAGSWRGGRGLPSVIGTRGLVAAGYAAAEAYVPFGLITLKGLSPVAAGAALTAAAITWFGGAWVGTHWNRLSDELKRVRFGLGLTGIGVALTVTVVLEPVPPAVLVLAWAVSGLGMGLGTPGLGNLVLRHSPTGTEGANSAAAQLNEAVVIALTLAVGSIGFAALLPVSAALGVAVALGIAVLLLLTAWVPLGRIGAAPASRRGVASSEDRVPKAHPRRRR